jgi:hypothetical protein
MRTRFLCAVVALIGSMLVVASVAAALEPVKHYTFPAGAAGQISTPGTLSVLLPSGWHVTTRWPDEGAIQRYVSPGGEDLVHGAAWGIATWLAPKGCTLADIRRQHTIHGTRPYFGPQLLRQVGDRYLTLPIGKVWVQTVLVTARKGEKLYGPNKPWYLRNYVINRGTTRELATGTIKQHFIAFQVTLTHTQYATHNAQITAIMRSIRFLS